MLWLIIAFLFLVAFLYTNRKVIGQLLTVADEVLGEYNDQYDHGPPPPSDVKKNS